MRDIDPFDGSPEGEALWALDQYVSLGHDLRNEGAAMVAPALALCGQAPTLVRAPEGLRIWRALILPPEKAEAAQADPSILGHRAVSSWTSDRMAARTYARELALGMGTVGHRVVVLEGHVPAAGRALDVCASYGEAGWATPEMETWSRYAGVEEEIILDRDAWPPDARVVDVFIHGDPALAEMKEGERIVTRDGVYTVSEAEALEDGWRVWFDEEMDSFLVREAWGRLVAVREDPEAELNF